MKQTYLILFIFTFLISVSFAKDTTNVELKTAIHKVISSLIKEDKTINFPVADTLFAIDNGKKITKKEFANIWPKINNIAFTKKITMQKFTANITYSIQAVTENKGIMSNKNLLKTYKPQKNDIFCDLSKVKNGSDNFIAYDKAFIYIFRKINNQWILIAIGG